MEKVLERDDHFDHGGFAKGSVMYQMGDMITAQECWEKAVSINPDLSEAVVNLNFLRHEDE